jgi:hypothetical protein
MRYGSCSNDFKLLVHHRWIIKNVSNCNSFLLFPFKLVIISIIQKSKREIELILRLTFACFQNGSLQYNRVGAGAVSKNFPGAEAA